MGPKYLFYSETCVLGICLLYIVADISARERKSGQVSKIFNKIIIPSYNGDIPIVHCDVKVLLHNHGIHGFYLYFDVLLFRVILRRFMVL